MELLLYIVNLVLYGELVVLLVLLFASKTRDRILRNLPPSSLRKKVLLPFAFGLLLLLFGLTFQPLVGF